MIDVGFSRELRDFDGDEYEECILIHIDKTVILKFADINELKNFQTQINACIDELEE